jgi:hypothetical protein
MAKGVKTSGTVFKPLALRERGWGEGFKGAKGSNNFDAIALLIPLPANSFLTVSRLHYHGGEM